MKFFRSKDKPEIWKPPKKSKGEAPAFFPDIVGNNVKLESFRQEIKELEFSSNELDTNQLLYKDMLMWERVKNHLETPVTPAEFRLYLLSVQNDRNNSRFKFALYLQDMIFPGDKLTADLKGKI
jgi:hypothetical protein